MEFSAEFSQKTLYIFLTVIAFVVDLGIVYQAIVSIFLEGFMANAQFF